MNRLQYVLDTDICIYLLNGRQAVKDRVAQVGIEAIAISIVTVRELYFGAYHSSRIAQNLERIRTFLTAPAPAILPLNDQVMESFGKFKAELRRKGRPIGDIDLLIASVE